MSSLPLNNLTILVTRPKDNCTNLCQNINQLGGNPIALPTIEITSLHPNPPAFPSIEYAIFVSLNAVKYGIPYLKQHKITPKKYCAIGPSTNKMLEHYNIYHSIYPTKGSYNSTSLLQNPELGQVSVNNKNIIILRGTQGLDTLEHTLIQRDAKVYKSIVYKQAVPYYTADELSENIYKKKIDLITINSATALNNLLILTDAAYHNKLKNIPLLVVSVRLSNIAIALGFKNVITSKNADDSSVIAAILSWNKRAFL